MFINKEGGEVCGKTLSDLTASEFGPKMTTTTTKKSGCSQNNVWSLCSVYN